MAAHHHQLGILELSESLSAKIDAKEDLPKGGSEVELRYHRPVTLTPRSGELSPDGLDA